MSSRCTPFGLFAGVGIGNIGMENRISPSNGNRHTGIARFDMHFLVSLAKDFAERRAIKNQLNFFPNPTLYRLGHQFRYVEYTYDMDERLHNLESVTYSEYLDRLLNFTKEGATISKLVQFLGREGFMENESNSFINELITNQILVSELEPSITGKDFLTVLETKISSLNNISEELELIRRLQSFQKDLSSRVTNKLERYEAIQNYLTTQDIKFNKQFLPQTDLFPKFDNNVLKKSVLRKVLLGIWALNKIHQTAKNPDLEQFKSRFNSRYEHQQIPLMQVMDIESGIGYANRQPEATPFLADIRFPSIAPSTGEKESNLFQKLLLEKLNQCLLNNKKEILLDLSDLNPLEENWNNAADTLAVIAILYGQKGDVKIYMDTALPHDSRVLGRFGSHGNAVEQLLSNIVKKEEMLNADSILAEILHIPESRTGNILRRPQLRANEIPCLASSLLEQTHQIKLQDILVSIENDMIVLTHGPTGRHIKPRLSNAHNFNNDPLAVYHFLCDLQYQEQQGYFFSWGAAANKMRFLPRVRFKNIIFFKARWLITGNNLNKFKQLFDNNQQSSVMGSWKDWIAKLMIPEIVRLKQGYNTLLINFKSNWSRSVLFQSVKNKDSMVLEEVIEEDALVKRDKLSYMNEFVFSFFRESSNPKI